MPQTREVIELVIGSINNDGAYQAMTNLIAALQQFPQFQDNLGININEAQLLSKEAKQNSRHHAEFSANQMKGRIKSNALIACMSQDIQTTRSKNIYTFRMFLCILSSWKAQNPSTEIDPPSINFLCSKLRAIAVAKVLIKDNVEELGEKELIEHFLTKANKEESPFYRSSAGLNLLKEAISNEQNAEDQGKLFPPHKTSPTSPSTSKSIFKRNENHLTKLFDSTDESEPNIQSLISLSSEELNDLENVSAEGRVSRLKSARFATEMQNQHLPLAWNSLTEDEVKNSLSHTLQESNFGVEERALFLIILLMSATVDSIQTLQFNSHETENLKFLTIDLKISEWRHCYPELPNRFQPNETQTRLLEPCSPLISQPIPTEATPIFKELFQKNGPRPFTNKTKLDELLSGLFTKIERNTNGRITIKRLRSALFYQLICNTNDHLLASHAISNDEFSASVADYYYSSDKATLTKAYKNACVKLGLSFSAEITGKEQERTGSYLYFAPSKHKQIINDNIDQLEIARRKMETSDGHQTAVAFHNMFTCFVAWILWCASGVRPRKNFPINTFNLSEKWLVIDDKSKPYLNTRLIPLAALVQTQLQLYMNHLKSLAIKVRKQNQTLSAQISLLNLSSPALDKISLFFLLDEQSLEPRTVSSSDILSTIKIPESLPTNLARHWFVSGPREYNIPAEWISSLTGHVGLGQRIFSPYTPFSPNDPRFTSTCNKGISAWLNEIGFTKAVRGIECIGKLKTVSYQSADITPELPKNTSQPYIKSAKIVRAAIAKVTASSQETKNLYDPLIQEEVVSEIESLCSNSAIQLRQAHNLFLRFIDRRSAKSTSARFSYYLDGEPQPSLFKEDALFNLHYANLLKERLIKNIPVNFRNLTPSEQHAWLGLHLMFSECVLIEEEIKLLTLEPVNYSYQCQSAFWLEWRNGAYLKRRELSFTSSTILNALNNIGSVTWRAINQQMLNIARGLLRTESQRILPLKLPSPIELAKVWHLFNTPTVLYSQATGLVKSSSLPQTNFLSVKFNKALGTLEKETKDNQIQLKQFLPSSSSKAASIRELKTDYDQLKNLIKENLEEQSSRSNDDGHAKKTNKFVAQQIAQLKSDWIAKAKPPILSCLCDYACHLVSYIQSNSKHYSLKTILDYLGGISIPMIEVASSAEWSALDEDELEDYYLDFLSYSSTYTSRIRRASRIMYFHDFCVAEYGLDDIAFAELDPAFSASRKSSPHARILNFSAYQTALGAIEASNLSSSYKDILSLALILLFRFSLRLGEVLGLSTKDIEMSGHNIVVLVRRNRLGGPKSRAGTRQVHSWQLSDYESKILERRLKHLEARYNSDESALFSQSDSPWQLISRKHLSQTLLKLLKRVSGDPLFRLHHARHTTASTEIASILGFLPESLMSWLSNDNKTLQQRLLGEYSELPTSRMSYAIANKIGHRSPSTTLESYTHLFELSLYEHLQKNALPFKNSSVIAKLLGTTSDIVRQARSRYGVTGTKNYEEWLLKKCVGEDSFQEVKPIELNLQTQLYIDTPFTESKALSLREIDCILTNLNSDSSIELISKHFPIENPTAIRLRDLHEKLQRELHLNHAELSGAIRISKKSRKALKHQLTTELDRLTNELDSQNAIDIWRDNYYATTNINGLSVISQEQRDQLIKWLAKLPALYRVEIHVNSSDKAQIEKWRAENSLPISVICRGENYRSSVITRKKKEIAPQIFIKHLKESETSSSLMPAFNLAMYLSFLRKAVYNEAVCSF